MNAVVEVETASMVPAKSANPTAEVVAHAKTVQQVMQAVMKPNVHYGAIPGAGDKPTLLKSGAEVFALPLIALAGVVAAVFLRGGSAPADAHATVAPPV